MTKWRLKACSRCGGDTYIDNDMDGWYEQCLLCGQRHELRELTMAVRRRSLAAARARNAAEGEEREEEE